MPARRSRVARESFVIMTRDTISGSRLVRMLASLIYSLLQPTASRANSSPSSAEYRISTAYLTRAAPAQSTIFPESTRPELIGTNCCAEGKCWREYANDSGCFSCLVLGLVTKIRLLGLETVSIVLPTEPARKLGPEIKGNLERSYWHRIMLLRN